MSKIFKFGIVVGDSDEEFFYNDSWCIESYPNYKRITVAPIKNQIDLMLDILKSFEPPYWCLYVLVVPRNENEEGRYQCPYPMSYVEISEFVNRYKKLLETDGRHHLWLASTKTKQLMVYDRHNIIYIYDDITKMAEYLKSKGFNENKISIPFPHVHHYQEDDIKEADILKHWSWIRTPLREQDDY